MRKLKLVTMVLLSGLNSLVFAQDISGIWKTVDDKTGESKVLLEISKDSNDVYTGKIIKITPRPGYTPKETCVNCPPPYTNKPILGMNILTGLKHDKDLDYKGGKIIDPLSGKIYSMKAKLSPNGKRLQLRGYIGISALGRNQVWIRYE